MKSSTCAIGFAVRKNGRFLVQREHGADGTFVSPHDRQLTADLR
jgi:hypothetical protein